MKKKWGDLQVLHPEEAFILETPSGQDASKENHASEVHQDDTDRLADVLPGRLQ